MLSLEHLDVYYGVIPALRDLSVEVNEGEIVTLIGANGAGKSTTLKTICGLLKPKKGQVKFRGKVISGVAPNQIVQMGISQVPEGRGIFPNLSVLENLMLGAYTRKDKAAIKKDLLTVYAKFPRLEERKNQSGSTLSGGEQQMLAMGRGLMAAPDILLLDEPSMGLAPILVKEIFRTILEIRRLGKTILLVEQNAHMALSIADRAYVLETGKVAISGTAAEMKANKTVQRVYLAQE